MKRKQSGESSAIITKKSRKSLPVSAEEMKRLPQDMINIILNLWLPRHWITTYPAQLKNLEKIGYFRKEVYIRRKSSKTNNWFVDYKDMDLDRLNPKGEGGYKRGMLNAEMQSSDSTIGWIKCIGSRKGTFSAIQDPWIIGPNDYPIVVKLHPRKRKGDGQVDLKFRGIYHKVDSCTWAGVSCAGVATTLGSTHHYMITSVTARYTLRMQVSAAGQWEICSRRRDTFHFAPDLLTFLHNK